MLTIWLTQAAGTALLLRYLIDDSSPRLTECTQEGGCARRRKYHDQEWCSPPDQNSGDGNRRQAGVEDEPVTGAERLNKDQCSEQRYRDQVERSANSGPELSAAGKNRTDRLQGIRGSPRARSKVQLISQLLRASPPAPAMPPSSLPSCPCDEYAWHNGGE